MANKFEKISEGQFKKDVGMPKDGQYQDIKLPKRATKHSAGYDIFALSSIVLEPGQSIRVPTGIKMQLDRDKFLAVVPRSGLGFRYRLQLDNTLGVVDSDYYNSDNEGHIWVKMTNDTRESKKLHIKKGEAFAQGIILQYFKTNDDAADAVRKGGFGSTSDKSNL